MYALEVRSLNAANNFARFAACLFVRRASVRRMVSAHDDGNREH